MQCRRSGYHLIMYKNANSHASFSGPVHHPPPPSYTSCTTGHILAKGIGMYPISKSKIHSKFHAIIHHEAWGRSTETTSTTAGVVSKLRHQARSWTTRTIRTSTCYHSSLLTHLSSETLPSPPRRILNIRLHIPALVKRSPVTHKVSVYGAIVFADGIPNSAC